MDGAGSYSVAHRAGLPPTELTGMWGWILLRSPHQGRGSPPAPAPTQQRPDSGPTPAPAPPPVHGTKINATIFGNWEITDGSIARFRPVFVGGAGGLR